MKYLILVVVCLLVGFLAGFVPTTLKNSELKGELTRCGDNLKDVYDRLEVSEPYRMALVNFVGAYEATWSKNFGIAKTRAIEGFDRAEKLAEEGVNPFGEIAARRDEIVGVLSAGGEDAEPKMRTLLFELYPGDNAE